MQMHATIYRGKLALQFTLNTQFRHGGGILMLWECVSSAGTEKLMLDNRGRKPFRCCKRLESGLEVSSHDPKHTGQSYNGIVYITIYSCFKMAQSSDPNQIDVLGQDLKAENHVPMFFPFYKYALLRGDRDSCNIFYMSLLLRDGLN
ncbi:hypothetical protein ILYODFUR_008448 [Ilyodon furcidens]|uniref:Uncharacterized protein n=1 Tax=Ilyodon furcidens TaxID=33524 RepID=A0ABV0URX9_9TELE